MPEGKNLVLFLNNLIDMLLYDSKTKSLHFNWYDSFTKFLIFKLKLEDFKCLWLNHFYKDQQISQKNFWDKSSIQNKQTIFNILIKSLWHQDKVYTKLKYQTSFLD